MLLTSRERRNTGKKTCKKDSMSKRNSTSDLFHSRLMRWAVILLALLRLMSIPISVDGAVKPEEIAYKDFLEMAESGEVKSINWSEDKDEITFYDQDEKAYKTDNPKYEDFKKEMLEMGIHVNEGGFLSKYGQYFIFAGEIGICLIMAGVILYTAGLGNGSWNGKKKKSSGATVKFTDVAGLDEVKEDLITVVDFLKSPQKYKDAGAEIPKGILLYGPPGTGKTLLAKAVAGEAGVKFIAASGSDFDEKYVGVGAGRIRKMFEEAKQNAPCIIFLDEIDSLGGKRNEMQSNSDRQTLNSFLSEMDGFDGSGGVVVMAATNRLEDLDPALTRPGRFDSHFAVGLPETSTERRKVIDLYARNKKFSDDVDFDVFAKETAGSSPAMVKTILNEAAIMAVRQNGGIINRNILDESWMKQLMEGHLKKGGAKDNLEIISWHEAGHALAGVLSGQDLTKVSIIPSTSGTGGATFITPRKMNLFTRADLESQIVVLYAGRCGELLLHGDEDHVTSGASNDLEKASEIIKEIVCEYGMDKSFGLLNPEVFDAKPEAIMQRASEISRELEQKTYNLLKDNIGTLKRIAEELAQKETLTGKEVMDIVEEIPLNGKTFS